jgi:hypothetical protein
MKAIFYSICATLCVVSGLYIGLALAGMLPLLYETMGGVLYGLAPVTLGMLGMYGYLLAYQASKRG